MAAGNAQQPEGFIGGDAEPAGRFGEEPEMEPGFGQGVPGGTGKVTLLSGGQDLRRDDVAEQAFGGFDEDGIGQARNS